MNHNTQSASGSGISGDLDVHGTTSLSTTSSNHGESNMSDLSDPATRHMTAERMDILPSVSQAS